MDAGAHRGDASTMQHIGVRMTLALAEVEFAASKGIPRARIGEMRVSLDAHRFVRLPRCTSNGLLRAGSAPAPSVRLTSLHHHRPLKRP